MLAIKLIKSPIANNVRNRRTVAALGLRKIRQVVELPDNPSVRGMIRKVQHLIEVTEIGQASAPKTVKPAKATAKKPDAVNPKNDVVAKKVTAVKAPPKATVKKEKAETKPHKTTKEEKLPE